MKQLTVFFTALLFSLSSWALDLDSAKSQKLVGEKNNGYLGLIVSSNTEAAALISDINRKRRAKYQSIANKQNTQLKNIETIAGEKLTAKAKAAGQAYQDASGNWVQ
ncbi:YdbL family protein [Bacterioplanoides pacificum]|uniref:YdbL family protein n=1 Tax=Bacterioplanoides pacificum TaxID=1171596 RepID=A0ABV7VYV5_9GAMM